MDLSKEIDLHPGQRFRLHYGENNPSNIVGEIRAVVDDDKIIYRHWSKRRQLWIYSIWDIEFIRESVNSGHLTFE